MSDEVIGAARAAARVEVHGIVQAVGFRPFVYRLATEPGLELSAQRERPDASAEDFAALAHVVEQLTEGLDTAQVARARELPMRRRGASTSARR